VDGRSAPRLGENHYIRGVEEDEGRQGTASRAREGRTLHFLPLPSRQDLRLFHPAFPILVSAARSLLSSGAFIHMGLNVLKMLRRSAAYG
jgi:hypothetical protein